MDEVALEKEAVISITPLNFMLNGRLEQKSTGDSIASDSSSLLQGDETVRSRYLSPHVSSCHDFCKYGKKPDSKANATSSNFRKFLKKKKNLARAGDQIQVTILDPRQRRTKTSVEGEFLDKTEVTKLQVLAPMKSGIASNEKKTLQALIDNEQSKVRSLKAQSPTGETPLQCSRAPNKPDIINSREPAMIKKVTKSSMKNPISSVVSKAIKQKASPLAIEPHSIKKKVPLPPKRADVTGKPAITVKVKPPPVRSVSHLKSSRGPIVRRNHEHKMIRSIGTSKIGERKLLKPTIASLPSKSSGNLIARRNHDIKIEKNSAASKFGGRIILKPTPMSISTKTPHENALSFQRIKLRSITRISSPRGNVSSLQPRKLGNVNGKSTAHENDTSTCARKLRKVNRRLTADENDRGMQTRKLRSVAQSSFLEDNDKSGKSHRAGAQSESENVNLDPYTMSEESESSSSEVSGGEIESNNNTVEVSQGGGKKRERGTASSRPEESSSTPFKLKFRRGKVVSIRSDGIGVRRLWFSTGMLSNGNSNDDDSMLERRNFRMKWGVNSLVSTAPSSEAQNVVLKHQYATGKKDAQSLFNHVIEETASKLVESRKSKVKALVGAFETVISLQ